MHRLLLTIGLSLLIGIASLAAEKSGATSAEDGFVSLFNGKDFTGWVYGPAKKGGDGQNKAGKGYQIKEGGILYCTVEDGGNLFTEREYADFVLRFEFKLTPNANNGIGIRAPLEDDPAYSGMEIQVIDDGGSKYTKIRPEQHHGSVYDVIAAKQGSLKPVGEWNSEEIHIQGSKIKVTVNDTVIVDADLAEVKDEAVLKKHPGLKNKKGHIGFLGHGAAVEFRNVRIKELQVGSRQ